jgi:hypothetical protein
MAEKLDIKRVLNAIDDRNYDFYSTLTDEEKKSFSPYVAMRFASNTDSIDAQEWYITNVNEFVNKNHWDLSKNHKELLCKLFASCGAGVRIRHPYLKLNSKETTDKFEKLIAELNPGMKIADVKLLASMMDKQDREQLFDDMGFDKKQRKDYK